MVYFFGTSTALTFDVYIFLFWSFLCLMFMMMTVYDYDFREWWVYDSGQNVK
jgi:hypothetical protein